jgi:hypothetical protein
VTLLLKKVGVMERFAQTKAAPEAQQAPEVQQ